MDTPRLIRFATHRDPTGSLTPYAAPFPVARAFILHDLVEGSRRGGHAHHVLQELIIAVSGSFDVQTYSERGPHRWQLARATSGLYVPPNCWRELGNFSGNAVALVLASTEYDAADYVRDFAEFRAALPATGDNWFGGRRWQEIDEWKKGLAIPVEKA